VLPTLDAHAHLDPGDAADWEPPTGCVLAVSLSAQEAAQRLERADQGLAWGIGCHPRHAEAQRAFDAAGFAALMERTALVGEVGLDGGASVAKATQRSTFRSILGLLGERPRIVSIHAHRAEAAVIDELERAHLAAPILHRFAGSATEAARAVRVGCYFSVHAAVARRSLFRTQVPLERVLVETDHGYADPPAAIPLRIGWVEHLVGQAYGVTPEEVRVAAWRNFARLVEASGTRSLLPGAFAAALAA
jgi:TatD DNase family protein